MRVVLAILSIAALLIAAPAQQSFCATTKIESRVESVLGWLPLDTESIAVLQSPVTYDVSSDQPIDPGSVYESPFVWSVIVNHEESPYAGETLELPMSDISLSVQSAGKWRSSKDSAKPGDRAMSYISFLRPDSVRDTKMRASLRRHAHLNYKDCGQLVSQLVLKDTCPKKQSKHPKNLVLYKCLPHPSLLIVTTDRSLMHTILSRMVSNATTDHALPADLREWQEVDTNARYWGLRHFQTDDPTSPLTGSRYLACLYPQVDQQATGFVFSFDPESGILNTKYLSQNPNIESIAAAIVKAKHIGGEWGPTATTLLKPGVVQIKVGTPANDWNAALFSVHAWLGAPTPWPFGGC
jgi:hypothetical protein